jgi:hypothetical protein
MASTKKKFLVAGLLTAVAAGAFYTFSGNDKTPAGTPQQQPIDATAIYQQVDAQDYIMAETKDNQVVRIYLDVPQLATGGGITEAALAKDIRQQSRMGLMHGISQWTKAELPTSVGSIENDLALFLGNNVTIGVDKASGNLIPAVEGVNFGAPKVQKIVDGKTQQVIFELPVAAPAIVAPALPKPPGA